VPYNGWVVGDPAVVGSGGDAVMMGSGFLESLHAVYLPWQRRDSVQYLVTMSLNLNLFIK
jgi:hypothetical protein